MTFPTNRIRSSGIPSASRLGAASAQEVKRSSETTSVTIDNGVGDVTAVTGPDGTGSIAVLKGNLAPEGSVAKISGKEGECFEGKARVFDSEEASMKAILGNKIKAGDVIVIEASARAGGKIRTDRTSDQLVIYRACKQFFDSHWHGEGVSQIQITALDPEPALQQLDLFSQPDPKRQQLNRVQDAINGRFGQMLAGRLGELRNPDRLPDQPHGLRRRRVSFHRLPAHGRAADFTGGSGHRAAGAAVVAVLMRVARAATAFPRATAVC